MKQCPARFVLAMAAVIAIASIVSGIHPKSTAAFFALVSTIAMAGLWELVEWQYAVIDGGEAGAAFLGSQGDEWDAQKNILCDTLGSLCAVAVFLWQCRKTIAPAYTPGEWI